MYNPLEDATDDPGVLERMIPEEDITVARTGFFQGYARPNPDNPNVYEYRFNKYGSYEAALESMANMMEYGMVPEVADKILAHLKEQNWNPENREIEIWENPYIDGCMFVSNYIPNETHGVKFTMVGDHTHCTPDHCFKDDIN